MDPYKYFPNRRPNEEVVMLLRRHWKAIVHHFMMFTTEFFLPLIIFFLFIRFTDFSFETNSPLGVVIILAVSLYYLFIWLFFFSHWLDYYLDVWVVTNERIINIEQKGLFSRTIAELDIVNVQDVTSEVKGRVATFLNFGDVHIQTAAEKERFIFEEIPNPQQVASKIIELHQLAEERRTSEFNNIPSSSKNQSASSRPQQNETKTI